MQKKPFVAMTALSLVVLLIAGTFAWTNFGANIINVFMGPGAGSTPTGPGGTLHNDFTDGEPYREVYIENWGTEPLIVRINISEYMEMGQGAGVTNDPTLNQATPLVDGTSIDDVSSWTPFNGDLEPMIRLDNADNETFRDYWRWHMGGQKYFFPAPAQYRTDRDADVQFVSTNSPRNISGAALELAQQTLNARVITMSEWVELGEPMGHYWVVDTDGFSYWVAPLESGDATGLLLHKVELIRPPVYDYYYAMNIAGQMATVDDSPDNYEQMIINASSDAERLIRMLANAIRGEETPVPSPDPSPEATATPVPSPAATATPVPSPAATATPVPSPVATATPVPSPAATATPVPSPAATATPVPSPAATATPVPSPAATATPVPSPAATATPVPSPVATATPVPSPAATATPVPSPVATATPAPSPQTVRLSSKDYFNRDQNHAIAWLGTADERMNTGAYARDVLSARSLTPGAGFSFRDYLLDGQYNSISGTLFLEFHSRAMQRTGNRLVIWGDGVQLYRSPDIRAGSFPVEFNVDVSGVSVLRIAFEFEQSVGGLPRIGISETQLTPRIPDA